MLAGMPSTDTHVNPLDHETILNLASTGCVETFCLASTG